MKSVHYIRFAQALIIAAVPACTAAVESKNPEPETSTAVAASSAKPEGTAAAQSDAGSADAAHHNDASVDGALPFSSGPIVPPEMPLGFC
jgi:hypothetical protein